MQALYNQDISINPFTGKLQRGIYLERKLAITGVAKMPTFDAWFRLYNFKWMTRAPEQNSAASVREFYVSCKMEVKQLNPQGQLQKGVDLLSDLIIQGVRENISSQTICIVLNGPEFLPPSNISEIDFRVDKIQKVKVKQIRSQDKLIYF